MSKEIITQVMKATCEGCGQSKSWDLIGADANESMLVEMQEWYVVGRKVVDQRRGLVSISADACCLACVPVAAIKLALPPSDSEPDEPKIDLSALRVN